MQEYLAITVTAIAVIVSAIALAAALAYIFPMLAGLNNVEFPSGVTTTAVAISNGGKTYLVISSIRNSPTTVEVVAGCPTGVERKTVSLGPGEDAELVFDGSCEITIIDNGVSYKP